ncbi:hypothetical protein Lal_00024964 [Lupinus albus]|nr:hypothetical protein Lal_00024964 [Lupinus albus]
MIISLVMIRYVIIGDCSARSIWALKGVLKLFELSYGLKINYSKRSLFGVNIKDAQLNSTAAFLHCKLSAKSFTYLGIPVGVSHKRKSTWNSLINKIRSKLTSWKSSQISFGGRVTLLNAVLSALPVYYLSFYKAHLSVVRSIQKLQRLFLWGGGNSNRKIHWVKCDKVCSSKSVGGLGVKDIFSFNRALLGKWNWRLVTESGSLWCQVLFSKYGRSLNNSTGLGFSSPLAKQSSWVRDLDFSQPIESRFWGGMVRIVGDESNTSFWHDNWIGSSNLFSRYRRLYNLSHSPFVNVSSLRNWVEDKWVWHFSWRCQFFMWELDLFNSFLAELKQVVLFPVKSDGGE